MNRDDSLFPVTKMDEIFDEIEGNTDVELDPEQRDEVISSMLEKNREMVQTADKEELDLFLLKKVYEVQNMAKMLGTPPLAQDLQDVATELEEEVE